MPITPQISENKNVELFINLSALQSQMKREITESVGTEKHRKMREGRGKLF
jgi:hypothetical protein